MNCTCELKLSHYDRISVSLPGIHEHYPNSFIDAWCKQRMVVTQVEYDDSGTWIEARIREPYEVE